MESEKMTAADLRAALLRGDLPDLSESAVIRVLNSDRPDRTAMITPKREYTYGEMFEQWDRYAAVFSALGVRGQDGTRAAILKAGDADSLTAYFALNMLGVTVSMTEQPENFSVLADSIRRERISILIGCDASFSPESLRVLLDRQEEIGLRYIILLPNDYDLEKEPSYVQMLVSRNAGRLRSMGGILFMDDLLAQYAGAPVPACAGGGDLTAAIFRTSGSLRGTPKLIPMTNRQICAAAAFALQDEGFLGFEGRGRTILDTDISHPFYHVDVMLACFYLGCTLILTWLGSRGEGYWDLFGRYRTNIWISSPLPLLRILRGEKKPDLSAMELVVVGGFDFPADMRHRFNGLLADCGSNARVRVGYGLTELGGACILTPPSAPEDDSVGHPLPGVQVKLKDEETGVFYDITDGPRFGGLYIRNSSLGSGMLDGQTYLELTDIGGRSYLCTNDLFRVDADGTLTCCGRMNNYFVGHKGIRFDAGLIESAMDAEPGIAACVIRPAYSKDFGDTVPVMFVQTAEPAGREETVNAALCHVFIEEGRFRETNLPSVVYFTDVMPCSQAGKIDRYRLDPRNQTDMRMNIRPVYTDDRLTGIELLPLKQNDVQFLTLPDEMRKQGTSRQEDLLRDPQKLLAMPPAAVFSLLGLLQAIRPELVPDLSAFTQKRTAAPMPAFLPVLPLVFPAMAAMYLSGLAWSAVFTAILQNLTKQADA